MDEMLTEAIKATVQWLFMPLLVLVVLAWLYLRIEALGAFDAICSAVRKMSVFQRFAAALAASTDYSIIELDPSFVHDVRSSYQAAFFVGGNLPQLPVATAATFEDIYVRAPNPGVEYFGWLLYTSAVEPVSLSRCTVNAAGSEWVYGVQDFGTAPLALDRCSFVNFPSNLTGRSCGILSRSSFDVGGGAQVSVSRTVFDESFTKAIMIGRLENGVSNVISVANCIAPHDLFSSFNLEFVSKIVVTNAALSWVGFPTPDSPSVALGMGALAPLANDPATDTDGDGFCDYVEVYEKGTDPYFVDSDMDGISDYDEDQQGTDPTNPRQRCRWGRPQDVLIL